MSVCVCRACLDRREVRRAGGGLMAVRLPYLVLGRVEVTVGGRPLSIGRRRERCLLALLLLDAGRPVPVDRLADLLWDGSPPPHARRSLHSHVARLRSLLTDAEAGDHGVSLETRGASYAIHVDPDQVDAHRFRRLVSTAPATTEATARVELLNAALQLWRGPVLGDDASETMRGRVGADLAALHQDALERLMAELVAAKRLGEALPRLARLTAEHPAQEQLVELYMTGLYHAGRKAQALTAYERTRSWLADHLGIDPTPALRQLHQAVLRDEVVAAHDNADRMVISAATAQVRDVPAELPADVVGFVGRKGDLAILQSLLDTAQAAPTAMSVTAIAGTAGVGKTALAVHFGHQVADRFPDGQLYVNLRGYSHGPAMDSAEALTRLLGSLGVPAGQIPVDEDAAASLYRSRLAGKRLLILLDDAGSAEQVRSLLPAASGCLVLVTSRDRLAGLVASHAIQRLVLDRLDQNDARVLLAAVIGEQRMAAEPAAAAELARLCAHLPLALRMAAANLASRPHWTLAEYVAALEGDRLGMLHVDGDAAVHAAFEMSYARLTAPTQRMFRLLGLAPGPDITAETAAVLADTSPALAERLLDQLAAAHLIEEHRPRRFSCHDLLRWHAGTRARQEDSRAEQQAAIERLSSWYLSTTARAAEVAYPNIHRLPSTSAWADKADVSFRDECDAMMWIDAERDNLVATVLHAANDQVRHHIAWHLHDALRGHLLIHANLSDWLAAADAALRAARAANDLAGQASAQLGVAGISTLRSLFPQSVEDHEAAVSLSRQAGWITGVGAAYNNLALIHIDRGYEHQAIDHLRAAREAYQITGDTHGLAAYAGNLSMVLMKLGRLRESEEHARHALTLRRPGSSATAPTLINLAGTRRLLGHLDDALDHASTALALRRMSSDRQGEASALTVIASLHRDAGRLELALDHARAAWRLVGIEANVNKRGEVLNTLGTIYSRLHRYHEAIDTHRQVLRLARQSTMRYIETCGLLGLSEPHLRLGQHDDALASAWQALTLARQAGYRLLEGVALTTLAEIHHALGDGAHTAEYALRALAIHRQTGHRLGEDRTLTMIDSDRPTIVPEPPRRSAFQ
jgi:DNA-binding SARP family transcriptional activator